MYFNLPVKEIEFFKLIVSQPVRFISEQNKIEDFVVTNLSNVYSYLQDGVVEGTQYTIEGTIVDIDMFNDWKFVQCGTCRKKVTMRDGRYYCFSCQKNVDNPRQSYKLVVRIIDKGEEIMCVVFNEAATSLISFTVDELVNKSLLEGAGDPNWVKDFLLGSLCGHKVIFTIKVDKFNMVPNYVHRFAVTKYYSDKKHNDKGYKLSPTIEKSTVVITNEEDHYIVEDEYESLSKITEYEWELLDQALWGPCSHFIPSTISTMDTCDTEENDGVNKCISDVNDAEAEEDESDNIGVGHDNIEDHICNTHVSIYTLQDGEEIQASFDDIEGDSSEKSCIGSSIRPKKRRRLPCLCDESTDDDIPNRL
ncbi:unnamed protein product [Lactuca virosa]|uniref:Replication factor A C-terminal domain-containing protein n=1 Tax=Lactuca virosa TaxID=75947 RepID=A0AAU9MDC6_9ASTR|nr:unnamed protein product [Lactuca virosa]